jgi:uncharacterized protein YkwD
MRTGWSSFPMAARDKPSFVPAAATLPAFEVASDEVFIGSAPGNDLVIGDTTVSRRHARLTCRENGFRLTDLGSTNGTLVNGSRIVVPVDLNDGDEIRFGAAVFRFTAPAPAFTRRGGSRVTTVIVAIAVLFAAGFAMTQNVVNFSLLEDSADNSHASPNSAGLASNEDGTTPTSSPFAVPAPAMPADRVARDADVTADGLWLNPLNRYRQSVGLAPVTANPRLSHGDFLHSRYLVKNFGKQIAARVNLGAEMHFEDPSKPWYSAEGQAAGRSGNVDEMWDPRGTARPSWAIDNWMQSPFHRLPILNPRLHGVGYGYDCEDGVCIAALNLNSDVDPILSASAPSAAPIEYPPNGASIDVNSFDGEWPDPLASCPGYSLPAGYPITIQLGSMVNPGIASFSLNRTAPTQAAIEACAFDGGTYSNPDPGTQRMARRELNSFGAIVMLPRAPLTPGIYRASITTGGHNYSWSFSVVR